MSIAPIQAIRLTQNPDVATVFDDAQDKFIQLALYFGATSTTPTDKDLFGSGCLLIHKTDKTQYINVAADGATPSWTLFSGSTTTLLDGRILVGNSSNVATGVAMSGDTTVSNTGVVTIANNAVTTAKILNANVTLAKLAAGITPSHVTKFAGQHTTVGGATAEAITVTGALSTDLAFVQLVDEGTNTVTVAKAVVTADTLTVTFDADPGNDAVINYQIIRAAA